MSARVKFAMLCYAMLCYAMLCYAMLCYVVLSVWFWCTHATGSEACHRITCRNVFPV